MPNSDTSSDGGPDRVARAEEHIVLAVRMMSRNHPAKAGIHAMLAQAEATLALVEQQRANVGTTARPVTAPADVPAAVELADGTRTWRSRNAFHQSIELA